MSIVSLKQLGTLDLIFCSSWRKALLSTIDSGCKSVVMSCNMHASISFFLALPGLYLMVRSITASMVICFVAAAGTEVAPRCMGATAVVETDKGAA